MSGKEELTPMMRQYMAIKEKHQDMVLFFRLGDFYEMFGSDALEVSKLLNLTLTHRGSEPMCGIPYHAAKNYLKRLLDAGKKVAICEQLSLPASSKEIADRQVTEIYTPATVVDDAYLDSISTSFVLAANFDRKGIMLAWSDISTGEFYVRKLRPSTDLSDFETALSSISPKEIIVPDDVYFSEKAFRRVVDSSAAIVTKLPVWNFSAKEGVKEIDRQFPPAMLEQIGLERKDTLVGTAGALLSYIKSNTKAELPQLRAIEAVDESSYLFLNAAAIRNLELIKSNAEGRTEGSLFHAMNRTLTPSGARFLKEQIIHPLSSASKIEERLSWVRRFHDDNAERDKVRTMLSSSSDLERFSSKASMKRLTPRDILAIADTASSFFPLIAENQDYLSLTDDFSSCFDDVISFSSDALRAISRECTNINNEGTIILTGYDQKLDEIRSYLEHGNDMLSDYLAKIRAETGITNIKSGENRIIGSYIEVSKGQLQLVPDYFVRRQTLVGGERFTTPELEEIKARISNAAGEAAERERELFTSFLSRAYDISDALRAMGDIISLLDYYTSLAYLASECSYTEPLMIEEGDLDITDGRHPVVEAYTGRAEYVSNSFSSAQSRFALITGPNMAGKSTYLREIAIITLMAHMGSFVPAAKAVIPLTDKIFCRVGASDNIYRGESTFLVEMSETAMILRSATRRSLVIMDEIGRGTSTEDGMSIAYAVMQYLKKLGAVTLFATHYHELTLLDTSGIQLLHMAVREEKNTIAFLRKAEPGVSASSYGIHVARLAGLPRDVIKDAQSFQRKHFADYSFETGQGDLFIDAVPEEDESLEKEILADIEAFDLERSTPLDALLFISELRKKISGNSV